MKTKLTTLEDGTRTFPITESLSGKKPVLTLLMRLLWAAALALPVLGAQAGAVLTTLYSFGGTNDGASPAAALVQATDGSFYGTTSGGGTNGGNGTVFRISSDGALTSLYSFTGTNDGGNPNGLVQCNDGYFYGTTPYGGTGGYGTVFKISTNGALTTLYAFIPDASGDPLEGAFPAAALVQGSDGNFYGTTDSGGTSGSGTVFKISPNGSLTTLYSFTGNDGAVQAGLVQGSEGYLYGTTEFCDTNAGTVFKITTNGVLTSLHSFLLGTNGAYPRAGLAQGRDGNFYGTTCGRASIGLGIGVPGTVFKISTDGVLTTLCFFTGGNDGSNPKAALVQGSDGNFYGTTQDGGKNYDGTVFSISSNGVLNTLYSFNGTNDGANPSALVQATDGNFYGTTPDGGAAGAGTVFRLIVGPTFQAVTLTNGSLNLTWTSDPGKTYQLQYSSDLSSTNWANLGGVLTATAGTLSFSDYAANGPTRFYRVVLSP